MDTPVLRRPWWLAAASLVGWFVCTTLVVTFDADTNREQWVNSAASALASAFAAGVLGGGLIGWWQRREQKRTPGRLMFLQLQACARQLDELTRRVANVREAMWRVANVRQHLRLGTRTPGAASYPASGLFDLPITDMRSSFIKQNAESFQEAHQRLGSSPDWVLLSQFASHDADEAAKALDELTTHVLSLAASLADCGLSDVVRDSQLEGRMEALRSRRPCLAAIREQDTIQLALWKLVVEGAHQVAEALGAVFDSITVGSSDPWMRQQVGTNERRSAELDAYLKVRQEVDRQIRAGDPAESPGKDQLGSSTGQ